MTLLAPHLTAFLHDRLAVERGASPRTCDTYAYAFRLMLTYASRRYHRAPSTLELEQIDATFVADFLRHLKEERGNGPSSRNARLCTIKSFMRFIEHRVPAALDQVHRVLAIPLHRTTRQLVTHLDEKEYRALLDAPDPTTRLGARDRAILHLALAGGLRASELVGLRRDDMQFDGGYLEVHVRGKGRRERVLLLWREVARTVRCWLALRGATESAEVFLAARGGNMSRAGLEYVVKKHAESAARKVPSIATKSVSPHTLRHTCAVNMLRATGDTRKVALWLGHANSTTTDNFYLPVDPTEKLEALMAARPPTLRHGKHRPADRLLECLRPGARSRACSSRENAPERSASRKRDRPRGNAE